MSLSFRGWVSSVADQLTRASVGGLALLLGGVVHLIIAFAHRRDPRWMLDLGLGALGVVLGVIVLAWPGATLVILAVLFGIRAVVVGLLAIAAGWELRKPATGTAPAT